jgi:hypothetical protein
MPWKEFSARDERPRCVAGRVAVWQNSDLDTRVLEPTENPFGQKLLPMYPVRSVSGLDRVSGFSFRRTRD